MKWLNFYRIKLAVVVFLAVILFGGGSAEADFIIGEPTNLGQPVNSGPSDCFDCLSADGLEIYLDRADGSTHWLWDIWVAKRPTIDDDWGEPVKLGSNINTPDNDECYASISADGLELYFCCGDIDTDCDLYVASRETTEDEWLPAVSLGEVVNSSAIEEGASISADGLSLYFGSDRSGGEGGKDLYVTTRQSRNQAWSTPVNIGTLVNSSSDDSAPSISSDGLSLIFSSNRPGKYSSGNLPDLWFTTRRTTSDPWQEPINLGPMINTDDVDSAGISPDGWTLYLSCYGRDWGYGFYDIWQAPIIPIVDFDDDGAVDIDDLVIMIENWGTSESLCDIGPMPWGDGIVNRADLEVFMGYYNQLVDVAAYYKLDEAEGLIAYDSSGYNNDAIVIGDSNWQPDGGMIDGAIELNGIDDFISTPFILNPGETLAFSVFAWIKGVLPGQTIISQSDGVDWLAADLAEGCLVTELNAGGRGSTDLLSQTCITDGQWHRIGFVWDGSDRILYVDDIEVARDTEPGLLDSEGGLYIGVGNDLAPETFFSGLIDDIRIYNRAITP